MRKCMNELVYLLKAKMQCIWIDTYEEYEVIKDLRQIVNDMPGMKLNTWSHTEGMKKISLHPREKQEPADKRVSIDKIFEVINRAQDNPDIKDESIYVLKDLHLLNDTHQVKRLLRDVKEKVPKNYNPIIIISPLINIPMEHEKLFTILHYETPSKEDIKKQLDKMISSISKAVAKGKEYKVPTEETTKHIIDACIGLTFNEINDVLACSLAKYKELSLKAIMEQKIQLVEKSGVLDYAIPAVNFEEVGGNHLFKQWIEEIEASMTDEAKEFGCASPKGYVALGVPGTAKSFLAEAIANKWGVPLLKLNMSRIMDKLVGQSEKKIEQAFRVAKACAPCVFLMDEVEKSLAGTKSSNASDAGTTSRVFAKVLEFLNDDNDVFVIMTSNDVSQLPPELTRSGRLDAMWYFSLPNAEERKEIFKIHLEKTGKEINDELIMAGVNATKDYTGAEIKEIVKNAMRKAFKRYKTDGVNSITPEDLISAAHDVIPIYESSKEKILYLEEWVKGRARYTNGKIDSLGFDLSGENNLIDDILELD